jgi:hypothetical protein
MLRRAWHGPSQRILHLRFQFQDASRISDSRNERPLHASLSEGLSALWVLRNSNCRDRFPPIASDEVSTLSSIRCQDAAEARTSSLSGPSRTAATLSPLRRGDVPPGDARPDAPRLPCATSLIQNNRMIPQMKWIVGDTSDEVPVFRKKMRPIFLWRIRQHFKGKGFDLIFR